MKSVALVIACLAISVAAYAQSAARPSSRQEDRARVMQPAPLMLQPDANRQPLRMAAIGTSLIVVKEEGDWLEVQFQDPQFGLRTGYIERKFVQLQPATLTPIDLSVPDTPASTGPAPARQATIDQLTQGTARPPLVRRGFWFSGGMGFGVLTCDFCTGYANGFSGGLSGGGTVNQHLLIGVGTTGWYRDFNGVWLSAGTFDGRIRYYPVARSGFHINAGAGVGSVSSGVGLSSISETGFGLMYGFGWDVRVGRNVSLTPFWNGSGIAVTDTVIGFGQLGLGITVH